jgi:MFS family permease
MVGWGAMALVQCAAKNFAGMLVIRLLLGAFEAGFFAGVVFYLTLFYTRGELGFRIALFFGSALLAGAFSGLISFGVFQIHHATIPGWKWLFIIEGELHVHGKRVKLIETRRNDCGSCPHGVRLAASNTSVCLVLERSRASCS